MTHGMTHGERHARRVLENSGAEPVVAFLDYITNGRKVSRWQLFIWALYGRIPCMDDDQLRERYGEAAFQVLMAVVPQEKVKDGKAADKKVKRRVKSPLKRKKRRLMPSDYAWILRESGRKYETVPDPRIFFNTRRSGRKHLSREEREQKEQQRLNEWWTVHTREIHAMKERAAARRAHKKLKNFRNSIFNRREQEMAARKTVQGVALEAGPRTAFVRVKPELYEIIVCGECPVFVWKESPGNEDMFQPNAYGPVKRVAVRPPGNSMKTPWVEFELEWSRRKLRETNTGSEWVWEIGLGDRIPDEEDPR